MLPLQNGVVSAEELAENIPAANIIGGLCKIISKVESPGVIDHFALDPIVIFGEFDSRKTERLNCSNQYLTGRGQLTDFG